MIVGITGKAGCGKSTLANYIADALRSAGYGRGRAYRENTCMRIMSFADPIRDVAAAVFGSRYETQESKAAIDEWWDIKFRTCSNGTRQGPAVTGRRILQIIGTDCFRNKFHPDIWLYAMERRLPTDPAVHVIIPDVRFDNEADWIRARGGRVVHLTRTHGDALGAPVDTTYSHLSEAGVRMKALDRACFASTLDGLRNIAGDIVKDYLI